MACALGFVVGALVLWNAGTQVVGRCGLAGAGDVVQLAFHRQQGCGRDVLRAHALHFALEVFDIPCAVDQLELAEHGLDGFQVVVGIHVEHGVVLVIELAVRFGAFLVALDQVGEVVVVAVQVAVGVHGHEAGVLQEAGVHLAACAREGAGHAEDHIVLKPLDAALGGQIVDGSG